MQTNTRIPHVPPQVRFQAISGHSGQFRPISAKMVISTGIGFGMLLKKKNTHSKSLKGPNDTDLDFTKKT